MNRKTLWILVLGAVVLLVALYFMGLLPLNFLSSANRPYQAVFLTNGQVYFGHLSRISSGYPVLREVFYLQIAQAPQPQDPSQPAPANINVVKLGGELHGPTDEMRINRDQILFIEDMKSDSRVVQAIEAFAKTNK